MLSHTVTPTQSAWPCFAPGSLELRPARPSSMRSRAGPRLALYSTFGHQTRACGGMRTVPGEAQSAPHY